MAEETPLEELMFEPKSGSDQLADYVVQKFTDVEDSRRDEQKFLQLMDKS